MQTPFPEINMVKKSEIFIVLFFCISLRAFASTVLSKFNSPISDQAYITSQILMLLTLIFICVFFIKKRRQKIITLIDIKKPFFIIFSSFALSIALFGFALGQYSIAVIIVSHIDIDIAHKLWNFPQLPKSPPDFFSVEFILNFVSAIVLSPFAEEIFFRKLLIESLLKEHSAKAAIIINSLMFSALHFHNSQFVSAFVFATTLSLLYLKSRSLLICIATHSIFNIFATFFDLYDIFPLINEKNLKDLIFWIPYLITFTLSIITLMLFSIRLQRLHDIFQLSHNEEQTAKCEISAFR